MLKLRLECHEVKDMQTSRPGLTIGMDCAWFIRSRVCQDGVYTARSVLDICVSRLEKGMHAVYNRDNW